MIPIEREYKYKHRSGRTLVFNRTHLFSTKHQLKHRTIFCGYTPTLCSHFRSRSKSTVDDGTSSVIRPTLAPVPTSACGVHQYVLGNLLFRGQIIGHMMMLRSKTRLTEVYHNGFVTVHETRQPQNLPFLLLILESCHHAYSKIQNPKSKIQTSRQCACVPRVIQNPCTLLHQ